MKGRSVSSPACWHFHDVLARRGCLVEESGLTFPSDHSRQRAHRFIRGFQKNVGMGQCVYMGDPQERCNRQ